MRSFPSLALSDLPQQVLICPVWSLGDVEHFLPKTRQLVDHGLTQTPLSTLTSVPVAAHSQLQVFRRCRGRGHRNERPAAVSERSEEHTSELQSPCNLVCRLLLEKKKKKERQER